MNIAKQIASELHLKPVHVQNVLKLLDEGNTIPFIARYRKEQTGAMHDDVLRRLEERLKCLNTLEERKESILKSIEEQGRLTEELKKEILTAETQVKLEDLYRPYRQKRRTRAMIAREARLEGLAACLLSAHPTKPPEEAAADYLSEEKGIRDVSAAIQGAKDIIAEQISDNAAFRSYIRRESYNEAYLTSTLTDESKKQEAAVYENFFSYGEALRRIPGHRILALNRGEKEKFLRIKVEAPEEKILNYLETQMQVSRSPLTRDVLKDAVRDAYKRLIAPSVENELRSELTEKAEDGAITVFGKNLSQLLLQPPVAGQTVLGWDPAFRTGCKIAVVDETGKVLDTTVIFPTAPQSRVKEAMAEIRRLMEKHHVTLISLGNGTASRESEQIIAAFLKETRLPVKYTIVNEAGASVYSASKLATEEFPDLDVGQRSAVSMARRIQDPLAELVKIDPRSIGVGQYQHDMNQARLGDKLHKVVEDCVNQVGVDVNTASFSLLSYVSGISSTVAKNIVAYREEHGRFLSRQELRKVKGLGDKTFLQSAGFLRIRGGKEPLDQSSVHPESYALAGEILKLLGYSMADFLNGKTQDLMQRMKSSSLDAQKLASMLQSDDYTITDILAELRKPGRDIRESAPAPVLRSDVLDLSDLKEGMILQGTVRNVIDFGVFVDIGVHQDGLVHISQLSDRFVKHPLDIVKIGDIVRVRILSVDMGKKKISLSMRGISS